MKKFLLFIAASAGVMSGFAQASNSVVFLGTDNAVKGEPTSKQFTPLGSGNKTTLGGSSWFDYVATFSVGTQGQQPISKGYYFPIYQDSNVVINGSSGAFNVRDFGMGQSFDPTDSVFFAEETSIGVVANPDGFPTIRVFTDKAYQIDSVAFPMEYRRRTSNDDTLVMQFVKVKRATANPFGIWTLFYSNVNDISPDGTADFASAMWDKNTNLLSDSIPAGNVITKKVTLDQAFANDTLANGNSRIAATGFQLNPAISLNAGEVLLSYVTIKSPVSYPLGTNENSANTMRLYGYDIQGTDGSPKQTGGSLMSGLSATRQNKYTPPYTAVPFQGHNILLSSLGYDSDGRFTHMAFRVTCATCPTTNVADIKKNIVAGAYPNPAADEVRVSFTLKTAADVNVTLTNLMGQVVKSQNMGNTSQAEAVFSTSDLANGVYIFTVNANGQRQTGRVVVSH